MGWDYYFKNDATTTTYGIPYHVTGIIVNGAGNTLDHAGVDIIRTSATIQGVNIYSPCNGKIVFVRSWSATAGNYVVIESDDMVDGKKLTIRVLHMTNSPNPAEIYVGKDVIQGVTIIGQAGNSGTVKSNGSWYTFDQYSTDKTTGAHLHVDINNENVRSDGSLINQGNVISPLRFYSYVPFTYENNLNL